MTHRFSPHRLSLLVLALALGAAVIATPASARKRAPKATNAKAACCASAATASCGTPAAAPVAPAQGGLRAFLDPETGQITGSIAPMSPTLDMVPTVSRESLVPVTLPNGSVMVDLQGTGEEYYVLRVDALGRRRVFCVQDARLARLLGATPLLPPTTTER